MLAVCVWGESDVRVIGFELCNAVCFVRMGLRGCVCYVGATSLFGRQRDHKDTRLPNSTAAMAVCNHAHASLCVRCVCLYADVRQTTDVPVFVCFVLFVCLRCH